MLVAAITALAHADDCMAITAAIVGCKSLVLLAMHTDGLALPMPTSNPFAACQHGCSFRYMSDLNQVREYGGLVHVAHTWGEGGAKG